MIDLVNGLIWQTDLPLSRQTQVVQDFINEVIAGGVSRCEREECLAGMHRTTLREYVIDDDLLLQVHIIYNSPPNAPDFMGIDDFIYTITPKQSGS